MLGVNVLKDASSFSPILEYLCYSPKRGTRNLGWQTALHLFLLEEK